MSDPTASTQVEQPELLDMPDADSRVSADTHDVSTTTEGPSDDATATDATADDAADDVSVPAAGDDSTADTPAVDDNASNQEVLGASEPGEASTTVKDPSDWVTGDEPMTGAQRSYLDTLARGAGEQLPADLTKAEASEQIERLQAKTGRGSSS